MKHILAFESKTEYEKYEEVITRFREKLSDYQAYLEEHFELRDVPRATVWTSKDLAEQVFSDLPVPAFTNKDIIYISPDVQVWRNLFVGLLEGRSDDGLEEYYRHLSENHVCTIACHELTHHSDLFLDEFDDEREYGIWFEEGMCDYLSRKFILSAEEWKEIIEVEKKMVKVLNSQFGGHSIDEFGQASYQGSLTSIMFDYFRSFLMVSHLVEEKYDHDLQKVFSDYHTWHKEGRKHTLTAYFGLENALQ